jgi:transposase
MRQYTLEFRQSAVNLVLVEGLSTRKAAENLGIPIHTIHSWVASARRGTGGLTSRT